jgi:hypothetical protein
VGHLFRRRLPARALIPGRYLTDGRRLLRVLSKFDDGRSVMALLEDCSTFDAYCYALLELRAMGFRRIRLPGADSAAGLAHAAPAATLARSRAASSG